jgi:hypothetical protein
MRGTSMTWQRQCWRRRSMTWMREGKHPHPHGHEGKHPHPHGHEGKHPHPHGHEGKHLRPKCLVQAGSNVMQHNVTQSDAAVIQHQHSLIRCWKPCSIPGGRSRHPRCRGTTILAAGGEGAMGRGYGRSSQFSCPRECGSTGRCPQCQRRCPRTTVSRAPEDQHLPTVLQEGLGPPLPRPGGGIRRTASRR